MHLTAVVVGCLLFGQVPTGEHVAPTEAEDAASAGGEVAAAEHEEAVEALPSTDERTSGGETPPQRRRLTAEEMVAEAIALPADSRLAGRPLTLGGALSSTADRRRQLDVAHAYWRLMQAVALYHAGLDHEKDLDRLDSVAGEAALMRAASAASLREAEAEVIGAQYALAAIMLLPPDAPLPLPGDPPHVGPYQTRFGELYSGRIPPARAALINRTLPILRQAIEARASAIQAAEGVLWAVNDGAGTDLPGVLSNMERCLRQRQALIASVYQYNCEIASYALAVAGPSIDGASLVGMLIKPAPSRTRPLVAQGQPAVTDRSASEVEPAGLFERAPTPAKRPAASPPPGEIRPTLAPREERPAEAESAVFERPMVPVVPPSAEPAFRAANKPVLVEPAVLRAPALYDALVGASPAVRTKQLATTLHWDKALPKGIGTPLGLGECLRAGRVVDRRIVVDAYWLVRQRAAEYQVLVQQAQFVEDLALLGGQPSAEYQCRAARSTADAALHEAHVALLDAQYELARLMGTASDSAWPLPSTVPHCGRYLLRLDAQPRRLAESWPLRRLAAAIPTLAEGLQQRAAAVVEADAARAAADASYRADGRSIEQALESVHRQTEQSLAFLSTLTQYNRAIAEYALTVLPPSTPSEKLASALVIEP